MLALIYLALAIALGDLLCGRFYRFVSVPQRCAPAILAGLACYRTAEPLLWADILFFVAAAAAMVRLSRKSPILDIAACSSGFSALLDQ